MSEADGQKANRGADRTKLLVPALECAECDLLVCTLPINLLLTSGYWPAIGPSLSLVTNQGQVLLIVPKDEEDLANKSWGPIQKVLSF